MIHFKAIQFSKVILTISAMSRSSIALNNVIVTNTLSVETRIMWNIEIKRSFETYYNDILKLHV